MFVLQFEVFVGPELDSLHKVEFVIRSDKGALGIVANPAYLFRRGIDQSRFSGFGGFELWFVEGHHGTGVGSSGPVAGFAGDSSHVGRCFDGNKPSDKPIPSAVAGYARFVVSIVRRWIQSSQ